MLMKVYICILMYFDSSLLQASNTGLSMIAHRHETQLWHILCIKDLPWSQLWFYNRRECDIFQAFSLENQYLEYLPWRHGNSLSWSIIWPRTLYLNIKVGQLRFPDQFSLFRLGAKVKVTQRRIKDQSLGFCSAKGLCSPNRNPGKYQLRKVMWPYSIGLDFHHNLWM